MEVKPLKKKKKNEYRKSFAKTLLHDAFSSALERKLSKEG